MMSLSEGNAYWTPEVLAQALLGIWFAASHQPWMVKDPVPTHEYIWGLIRIIEPRLRTP